MCRTTQTLVLAIVLVLGGLGIPCARRVFAAGKADDVSGTVVSTGERSLTLKTGSGAMTLVVPEVPKRDWQKRSELEKSRFMAAIAVKRALKPGMKVRVKTSGEKDLDGVGASGTIEGVVVGPEGGGKLLLVNVDGIDGSMAFVANWEKGPNGKWRPVPAEVERFKSLKAGTRVRIAYELEEHFRAKTITVLEQDSGKKS